MKKRKPYRGKIKAGDVVLIDMNGHALHNKRLPVSEICGIALGKSETDLGYGASVSSAHGEFWFPLENVRLTN